MACGTRQVVCLSATVRGTSSLWSGCTWPTLYITILQQQKMQSVQDGVKWRLMLTSTFSVFSDNSPRRSPDFSVGEGEGGSADATIDSDHSVPSLSCIGSHPVDNDISQATVSGQRSTPVGSRSIAVSGPAPNASFPYQTGLTNLADRGLIVHNLASHVVPGVLQGFCGLGRPLSALLMAAQRGLDHARPRLFPVL